MRQTISRRTLVLGGASALALAACLPRSADAQDALSLDQFRALSARLTGATLPDLDPGMAGKLLDGFVALGREPGLALLAANPDLTTGDVADDIVAGWYSGTYDTQGGPVVAGYTDALVWNALDFTKPLGFCGGETGYWADPPQS
jgi:hypothetical protein